jgi:hypothetical protein
MFTLPGQDPDRVVIAGRKSEDVVVTTKNISVLSCGIVIAHFNGQQQIITLESSRHRI